MSSPRDWVCLMYHDVTEQPVATGGGKAYFSVSSATFARQLSIIDELGLRGCSIGDTLRDSSARVAISFDDGDVGQAARAFPRLAARGMSATFFVTTSWVGAPGYATWDQLREMSAAGMSIQSHTHTHPFLSEMDARAVRDELRRSRDLLDERLEQKTTMIALPGGDAPRKGLRSIIAEEGYQVVATSRWGLNRHTSDNGPRYVRRCTVRGESSDKAFAAIVMGDRLLGLKKRTRELALSMLRASVGPTRYARWRRGVLSVAGGVDNNRRLGTR